MSVRRRRQSSRWWAFSASSSASSRSACQNASGASNPQLSRGSTRSNLTCSAICLRANGSSEIAETDTARKPSALQALGRSGEIIAILFGGTLYAPPSEEVSNKILWVAKDGTSGPEGLVISAQRMDGTERLGDPVERVVEGGPGPSTIDLPEAGCWRLSLAWADETDSLDLEYVDPTASP